MSSTNIVGGLRSRLIFDSIYACIQQGLIGLGWLDSATPRRNQPVRFVVEEQDVAQEVPINTLALIDENVSSTPWEIGSQLGEDCRYYYVDFFGESDAVSKHIIGDVRDILMGKMPSVGPSGPVVPVRDYRQATPPVLFGLQIVRMRVDRAHNFAHPWTRHWYSLSFQGLDYYNDESDPTPGAFDG